MFWSRKYGARRTEVRKNRPDRSGSLWSDLQAKGVTRSLAIAALFCLVASAIVLLREDAVPYRPGQYVPQDVLSRVDFAFTDVERLTQARKERREGEPRVYRYSTDAWAALQNAFLDLPERIATSPPRRSQASSPPPSTSTPATKASSTSSESFAQARLARTGSHRSRNTSPPSAA